MGHLQYYCIMQVRTQYNDAKVNRTPEGYGMCISSKDIYSLARSCVCT